MTRGGKREGAGRKPKYPEQSTKRYVRLIPAEWHGKLDAFIDELKIPLANK